MNRYSSWLGVVLGIVLSALTVSLHAQTTADFRVAKSYGSPWGTFFAQGGNAFGTAATLGTTDNQQLNIIVNGGRVMRYEQTASSPNIFGGYINNSAYTGVVGATIAGGGADKYAPIFDADFDGQCEWAYGCQNSVTDHFGTIGGGLGNFVGDGDSDLNNEPFSTVAGGVSNRATVVGSTVGGGGYNQALALASTIAGGYNNAASGWASTVPGGFSNKAKGKYSFAAGFTAQALYDGEFVWADASVFGFDPGSANNGWNGAAQNTFNVRATGGVWFVTGVASGQPASFVYVNPGSGTWGGLSDRASKENLLDIDQREILAKVAAVPLSTWNYIAEGRQVRHLGPMSQDFSSAFGLGPNDKTITHLDEAGVALAAIQGLNQLVLDKETAHQRLQAEKDAEIKALKERLTQIETALAQIQSANRLAVNQ